MPLFSYTARDSEDKLAQGTIDAVNLQAARTALQEMNLRPEEMHETTLSEQPATTPPDSDFSQPMPIEPDIASSEEESSKWKTTDDQPETSAAQTEHKRSPAVDDKSAERLYFPIIDTLRLYAGWLLTGYFVAYILGLYQLTKPLPFQIPYVMAFLYSPLILSFTFAAFLFLLTTSIHKRIKGSILSGIILAIIAVGIFILFRINT